MTVRGAVFLDRDDTIIRNSGDLGDPDDVVLLDGARTALSSLHGAGWPLIVVTNQGGVARGAFTEDDVRAVHARIAELLDSVPILDWLWCPWHPDGTVERYTREHAWRKPSPGMLLEAARRHDLDLSASWLVGDADRDIAAGAAAGCRTVKIGTPGEPRPDYSVTSIADAATCILNADA